MYVQIHVKLHVHMKERHADRTNEGMKEMHQRPEKLSKAPGFQQKPSSLSA